MSPRIFFWFYVSSLLAFCPAARWCGGLMMFSYAPLCPVMFDDVRVCSVMFDCSMISDDVRLSPMIRGDARSLRLPGRFGTVCRAASGPTQSVSCAAGSFHKPARAAARYRCINRAQPTGRASGVNCTQCWAATLTGYWRKWFGNGKQCEIVQRIYCFIWFPVIDFSLRSDEPQ